MYVLTPVQILTLAKQMPKFEFTSNARPALFAYPAPVQAPTIKKVEKVETAVLSTTARAAKVWV